MNTKRHENKPGSDQSVKSVLSVVGSENYVYERA
jgi:hypothetical protein